MLEDSPRQPEMVPMRGGMGSLITVSGSKQLLYWMRQRRLERDALDGDDEGGGAEVVAVILPLRRPPRPHLPRRCW